MYPPPRRPIPLQTHFLHGQTYVYDTSLADALRSWKRLDREFAGLSGGRSRTVPALASLPHPPYPNVPRLRAERTASNSIITLTTLTDTGVPQAGWRRRAQQQAQAQAAAATASTATASAAGYVWSGDADASTRPYTGWAAGASANETAASVAAAGAGSSSSWDDGFPAECGANIVTGGRAVRLLLSFNNDFNPSPFSAATVLTNIETCVAAGCDGTPVSDERTCVGALATCALYRICLSPPAAVAQPA